MINKVLQLLQNVFFLAIYNYGNYNLSNTLEDAVLCYDEENTQNTANYFLNAFPKDKME